MSTTTTTKLSHLAKQAIARYQALPGPVRSCLDYWIDHAVQPAKGYHEINKTNIEFWATPRHHLYVTNETFNGALLAHGYDVKPYACANDLDSPARFNATFTPSTKRRLRHDGLDPTPWDGEFDMLAARITLADERASWKAMGLGAADAHERIA